MTRLDLAPAITLPTVFSLDGADHQLVPGRRVDQRSAVCGLAVVPLLLTLTPPTGNRCAGCFNPPEEG